MQKPKFLEARKEGKEAKMFYKEHNTGDILCLLYFLTESENC